MATLRQKLDIAECALQEIEERLGAPFRRLRTREDVVTYFEAKRGCDGFEPYAMVEAAGEVWEALGSPDIDWAAGMGAAEKLTTLAKDLAERYTTLCLLIARKSGSKADPFDVLRENLVHDDLMPYVDRLRAKAPGLNDRIVAQTLFHFERRGGELLAWAHDQVEPTKF